jgi:uncharacterized protein YjbI with pentapeptide repeats
LIDETGAVAMKKNSIHPKHLMLGLLVSLLAACGGGSAPAAPRALSEHDFAADPSLRLAIGSVGVTALEPKDAASATSDDTGAPGTDEIPLRIAETTSVTYAMNAADNTIERVRLIKLDGNKEVFVLTAAQPRATVTLEPGDYQLILHSGYTVAEAKGVPHRVVFLHNGTATPAKVNASLEPKNVAADVWYNTVIGSFDLNNCFQCYMIGSDLHGYVVDKANLNSATIDDSNLKGVSLKSADLSSANMSESNLNGADLTQAEITNASLQYALLNGANMTATNLRGSSLFKADLSEAVLTRARLQKAYMRSSILIAANLTGADLTGADLTNANLTSANLTGANLTGANISGANFTGADLSGALWTNGIGCAPGSITFCRQGSSSIPL